MGASAPARTGQFAKPEAIAGALERCGELLFQQRRIAAAQWCFEGALARGADPVNSAQSRWMCAMLSGDFERAWAISDMILRARSTTRPTYLPRHLQWVWDGSPLAGKRVLVRCYHGLGDTLQFVRFVPLLARSARRITLETQPELLTLLRSLEGVDELAALGQPVASYDIDIEVMELPHALRITLERLPADIPYLRVPPEHAAQAAPLVRASGRRARIGLVWSAGGWRPERSIPTALLSAFSAVPDAAIFSLQAGPSWEAAQCGDVPPAFIWPFTGNQSVFDTAALMAELDLVVTVDTMAAHLAGALGLPVWTMLHFAADWRWMLQRTDSPWYPTMRLFRQSRPGAWSELVAAVVAELKTLTAGNGVEKSLVLRT